MLVEELKCDMIVSLTLYEQCQLCPRVNTWWSLLNTNQPPKQRKEMGVGGKEIRSMDSRQ